MTAAAGRRRSGRRGGRRADPSPRTEPQHERPGHRAADRAARPQRSRSGVARLLRKLAESPEAGVIIACVVVFIVIAINAPTYASVGNLQVMGRDLAQVGILAVGESLVILTGGIDLSVGALAGLAGIFAACFNVNEGLPAPVAIVLTTLVICAGGRPLARHHGDPAEGAAVRHHAGDVHRRAGPLARDHQRPADQRHRLRSSAT